MPLLNSMGSLRNMGINSSTQKRYFMYMFAPGTVNSNYLSQNDRTIGNYDSTQGKYISVDARNDQIVSFTDSSTIVFDGTQSFIYTPWMAPANNKCWFHDGLSSSLLSVVDLSNYNITRLGGTFTATGTDVTKVIVDSAGNTIKIGIEYISSVYYISVSKFTTSGIVWQKKITHPTGLTTTYFNPTDVCLDSSDNIYLCGQIGTTAVWGKITSAGAISWLRYYGSTHVSGLTVVGTTLYASMTTTNTSYSNYDWRNSSGPALPYIVAITASTGSMTKCTWIQYNGGGNPYVMTGIKADPSDPSSIFIYGFSQDPSSGVPTAKIVIFKFNAALTSISSQRSISFTPNLVANPSYVKNVSYIDRLVYQPESGAYYISGMTQDMTAAGATTPGSYYNGFVIRAQVDTDYTGTILNRTYTIASLGDSVTLNNTSTFNGTSFGVISDTAYTLTTSSQTMSASGTVPTKVNL